MKDHDNLQAFSLNDNKLFPFIINSWIETHRQLANKPSFWQKVWAFFKIKALPAPMYHITATVFIAFPNPLWTGDIFMLPDETLFITFATLNSNASGTEQCIQVASLNPIAKYILHTGQTFIVSHNYVENPSVFNKTTETCKA